MEQGESTPVWIGRDDIEWEFAKALRQAAWIFEKEKNGRFLGSIVACRAVARFIHQRGGGAELAGPFLQIAVAFEDLEKGGKPRLFSKKTEPDKERERSPERKHIQMLAAVALEVLVKLGDSAKVTSDGQGSAAAKVAQHVSRWPGMAKQEVTGLTVINWRKQLSRNKNKEYRNLAEKMMAEAEPRRTVERLLRNGPPGLFG
jgi:hypothetical protein